MRFELNSKYDKGQILYKSVNEGLLKVEIVDINLEYDTASDVPRFTYKLKVKNPSQTIGGSLFPAYFSEEQHKMEGRYFTSKEELLSFLSNSVD